MLDSIVKVNKDNCKILQLTDIQVIDSAQMRYATRLCPQEREAWKIENVDEVAFLDIDWLINKTNPDVIVITGDIVYGEFDDNCTTLPLIIEKFESYGIPWAPVWGNHDNECLKGVAWQCDLLEKAPNCLFKRGNVTGTGNYTVGIFNAENTLKRVLYMLNSHGCWSASDESLKLGVKRDYGFEPDQIAWLTSVGENLKKNYGNVPAFACFHTGTVDVIDALEKKGVYDRQMRFETERFKPYVWDSKDEFGELNETLQIVTPAVLPLFKSLGVDGVFLGHTHVNSFSIVSDGIRWTQGLKTGKYDYRKDNLLGGTVIEVSFEDEKFSVSHLRVNR